MIHSMTGVVIETTGGLFFENVYCLSAPGQDTAQASIKYQGFSTLHTVLISLE